MASKIQRQTWNLLVGLYMIGIIDKLIWSSQSIKKTTPPPLALCFDTMPVTGQFDIVAVSACYKSKMARTGRHQQQRTGRHQQMRCTSQSDTRVVLVLVVM